MIKISDPLLNGIECGSNVGLVVIALEGGVDENSRLVCGSVHSGKLLP